MCTGRIVRSAPPVAHSPAQGAAGGAGAGADPRGGGEAGAGPLRPGRLLRVPLGHLLSTPGLTLATNGPQLLLLHWRLLQLRWLLHLQSLQMHLLQEELLLLLPRGLRQVCPGLRLQRGLGQVQLLCLMSRRACPGWQQSNQDEPAFYRFSYNRT
ncbi:hypothetical protein J1605_020192 [Eschrichtius robustus]|uniref:Uncharacterized protein n=1 Tax=Eschrichtius robustus TaxID=9764 RepID=A0AB34HLL5_ESCRO|nr:hypothetical protein J1605_020192 [Eschrichtius robustus]